MNPNGSQNRAVRVVSVEDAWEALRLRVRRSGHASEASCRLLFERFCQRYGQQAFRLQLFQLARSLGKTPVTLVGHAGMLVHFVRTHSPADDGYKEEYSRLQSPLGERSAERILADAYLFAFGLLMLPENKGGSLATRILQALAVYDFDAYLWCADKALKEMRQLHACKIDICWDVQRHFYGMHVNEETIKAWPDASDAQLLVFKRLKAKTDAFLSSVIRDVCMLLKASSVQLSDMADARLKWQVRLGSGSLSSALQDLCVVGEAAACKFQVFMLLCSKSFGELPEFLKQSYGLGCTEVYLQCAAMLRDPFFGQPQCAFDIYMKGMILGDVACAEQAFKLGVQLKIHADKLKIIQEFLGSVKRQRQ